MTMPTCVDRTIRYAFYPFTGDVYDEVLDPPARPVPLRLPIQEMIRPASDTAKAVGGPPLQNGQIKQVLMPPIQVVQLMIAGHQGVPRGTITTRQPVRGKAIGFVDPYTVHEMRGQPGMVSTDFRMVP